MTEVPIFAADLVKPSSDIKSHLVEPVVTAVIQNRLSNVSALRFVALLVQHAQLKVSILLISCRMFCF
jgi:nucleolar pre-ribosomal-associated protein 1